MSSEAHFAGIRTFTLLGGLAGIVGWLWSLGFQPLAAVLLAGAAALVVAAYVAASRRGVDGTTEAAALVVLSAGVLAGTGYLVLASAIVAIATLLLAEKSRLHAMVTRIDDQGLRAGVRFAVITISGESPDIVSISVDMRCKANEPLVREGVLN